MRPYMSLQVESSTRLVMTPQLKQAIELLQMSSVELDSFLQSQAADNPLLEISPPAWEQPVGLSLARARGTTQWNAHSQQIFDVPCPVDPRKELLTEIQLASSDSLLRRAAAVLVDSLDARGFLPEFTAQFVEQVGFSQRDLSNARELLMHVGPPGIGARSVAECIALQLKLRGCLTPLAESILAEYLPLLSGRLDRIAARLNVSLGDVVAVVDSIRACHPYPGACFTLSNSGVHTVIPDVYITRRGQGFEAHVNQSRSASVANGYPEHSLREQAADSEVRVYLDECMRTALWLVRAVEHRRETLLRITRALIDFQFAYLQCGTAHLRPLTLAAVAAEIGVHESTVSRAIAQKFALTPRGLLPLKWFFDSGVKSSGGSIAAEAVKEKIALLIGLEDKSVPLSDEQIALLLKQQGIYISRRTVTKYRESISILPSAGRRRYDIMG